MWVGGIPNNCIIYCEELIVIENEYILLCFMIISARKKVYISIDVKLCRANVMSLKQRSAVIFYYENILFSSYF